MFTGLQTLVSWIFDSLTQIWLVMIDDWGCIGVCIIGFPVLRKLVNIFRRIF